MCVRLLASMLTRSKTRVPTVALYELSPDVLLHILRMCGGTSSLAVKCVSKLMHTAAIDALSIRLAQHDQFLDDIHMPCVKCNTMECLWTDVRNPVPATIIRLICSHCLYFSRLKICTWYSTVSRKDLEAVDAPL